MQKNKIVAVTGATGFVACEIICQLLQSGYVVHGTVRNETKSRNLIETFAIEGTPNPNLILFEADLLKQGSFDKAFNRVDYVIHCASPFQPEVADPQTDLIDPALQGTKNVLSSVEKSLDTIKKVVVTSSVSAIIESNSDPNKIWTECDWNNESSLTKDPYNYSKVLAEKASWEWAKGKEDKVKLITICPSLILGRTLFKRTDSTSINIIISLMNGDTKDGVPAVKVPIVSVRDVGKAHIAAIEIEEANGRYIASSPVSYSLLELTDALRKEFAHFPLATQNIGEFKDDIKLNNERTLRELGMELIGIDDMLTDLGHSLVKFGLVEIK